MTQEHPSGIYYVIPAQVFEDERLEYSEIMFYGLLSGLSFSSGYCFASDEYLAIRMRVHERTIRKWIERLEDLRYVERKTEKKGIRWERKIFITHSKVDSKKPPKHKTIQKKFTKGPRRPDRTDFQGRIVSKEILVSESSSLPPSSPEPVVLDLGGMRKKILSKGFTEEECDIAFEKFQKTKKVYNVEGWLLRVLESVRLESQRTADLSHIIEKRRQWAETHEWSSSGGAAMATYRGFSIVTGSREVFYPYDEDSDFWKGLRL